MQSCSCRTAFEIPCERDTNRRRSPPPPLASILQRLKCFAVPNGKLTVDVAGVDARAVVFVRALRIVWHGDVQICRVPLVSDNASKFVHVFFLQLTVKFTVLAFRNLSDILQHGQHARNFFPSKTVQFQQSDSLSLLSPHKPFSLSLCVCARCFCFSRRGTSLLSLSLSLSLSLLPHPLP